MVIELFEPGVYMDCIGCTLYAEHNLQSHDCQFLPKRIVTSRQRSSGGFILFVRSLKRQC